MKSFKKVQEVKKELGEIHKTVKLSTDELYEWLETLSTEDKGSDAGLEVAALLTILDVLTMLTVQFDGDYVDDGEDL